MKSLDDLVVRFQKSLRNFIVDNADEVEFSHSQYTVEKLGEGHYDITVSITGMGVQNFEISIIEDEFSIKGKMVDSSAKFPFHLLAELITEVITKCVAESAIAANPAVVETELEEMPIPKLTPLASSNRANK